MNCAPVQIYSLLEGISVRVSCVVKSPFLTVATRGSAATGRAQGIHGVALLVTKEPVFLKEKRTFKK